MSCHVSTKQGILNGKQCTTYYGKKYYSFEGIPYAKPPVGKLRFRNPEEPQPWTGVRDATKPGNKCAQLNPYINSAIDGSEDCLYLNVYTPNLPHKEIQNLPVIFFIHGGRLIYGYGDYYKPDYLIRHDIVLVTINYRLNVLGFLCLDIPEVPGNAGLKDAVMALRWVNRNIQSFNGDPTNVTVFGESAGGAIAMSLLTSKMATGLYSKVISQSSSFLSDLYMIEEDPIEKARNMALNLGKDLNDARSLYEYLVDLSLEDLIHAFVAVEIGRSSSIINACFLPVVEKSFEGIERFFEEYPLVSLRANRFERVPVIAGMNSHEAALFLQRDDDGNIKYETDFYYFMPNYLFTQRDDPKFAIFENKLRSFYLNNKPIGDGTKEEYLQMISDVYFQRDIMYFVDLFSKYAKDVYVYKFNFIGNMNTRVMRNLDVKGTTHGDIIQYQFYRKSKADKCTPRDDKIVDFLSETWCNFAKNGKPTWTNQTTEWLPYSENGRYGLVIDDEITLVKDLDSDRLEFWLPMMRERSKL